MDSSPSRSHLHNHFESYIREYAMQFFKITTLRVHCTTNGIQVGNLSTVVKSTIHKAFGFAATLTIVKRMLVTQDYAAGCFICEFEIQTNVVFAAHRNRNFLFSTSTGTHFLMLAIRCQQSSTKRYPDFVLYKLLLAGRLLQK